MIEWVFLICGFGRCGSSLVMQMLHAAGIDMDGTPPYYETPDAYNTDWIKQQAGRAIKVLEPHRHGRVWTQGNYRVIWLDRDHKQQAFSHVKFQTEKKRMVVGNSRGSRRSMLKWFDEERPKAIKCCESLGTTLVLNFEDLLGFPNTCAFKIARHCGIETNLMYTMASVVQKRLSDNRKTMDLEHKLEATA